MAYHDATNFQPCCLCAFERGPARCGPRRPAVSAGTAAERCRYVLQVADPYRWLEDIDSPQTAAWVAAESALTRNFLDAIPRRTAIKNRLTQLWNFERFGEPFREGRYYFYTHYSGLQNQAVMYVATSPKAKGRIFLDPNKLSKDGTVAIGGYSFTNDGRYGAYATQTSGSDWQTWHVRNVAGGRDLPDRIQWSKFSGASWLPDDSGFYYARYDTPEGATALRAVNYFQKIFFHKLGTPQSADRLVYQDPAHKDWYFDATVTEDGDYLILNASNGTDPHNRVYYQKLREPKASFKPLFALGDAAWNYVANDGPSFYVQTDKNAPRGRTISVDVRHPEQLRELVAQTRDTLQSISLLRNRFIARYLRDAHSVVSSYDLKGHKLGDVGLPGIGSAAGFGGFRHDKTTFYTFTGYTMPGTIYQYDVVSGKSTLLRKPRMVFDPSRYTTEQVFYTSKDGTRVPMFVSHKKDLRIDGFAPTILYGYGGFDVSITPYFSVSILDWMEMGGVYAVATLRGGNEYGEEWHTAGMLANKQHVFDDFIAAAQALIEKKYTSTPKLAINGGSNGGLLIGAVETQRPDLFGAAIAEVGVMDMLRFQKFTVGYGWIPEYGSSESSADQFKTLYAYSPYHNIKEGVKYPPTLIMTADHDDRVFPAHSFKFAAAMQHAQGGDAPILLRIESKAGHGAGTPTSKAINEVADRYAFLVQELGM